MKAYMQTLQALFGSPVSFRIPVFQRPYAWTQDKQWGPLWDDVREIAERLLHETDKNVPPHFMGAIVLQLQSANTGHVVKRIVVDGQQRLTTLQILLRAAQESFLNHDEIQRSNRIGELTLNTGDYVGGETDSDTKVRQSNVNDLESFQDVIRGSSGHERAPRAIGEAYNYFKTHISAWLDNDLTQRYKKAEALENVLVDRLQLATVDLDEGEKPHFIFSVLNARAEPLTQSDHVKNAVMYQANVIDDSKKAAELWGPFDRDEWWRGSTHEGRLTRTHLDRFLNYWVIMRTAKEVTAANIAAEFDNYLNSHHGSIEEIAADVRRAGQFYKDLEEARQTGIEEFLRRIKTMELGAVMPLLLWLYTSDVASERRLQAILAIESYLVRRMLCNMGSQGLNRLFVELVSRVTVAPIEAADDTIIGYLKSQTVDNRIWPSDSLIKDSLIGKPMRGSRTRRTMVFQAFERRLRSKMTEALGLGQLTIEHIMPVSWTRNWPLPGQASEDEEKTREDAIKEIGNLTLVSGKLNASLSNEPWQKKKVTLGKHTALRLNWELLEDPPSQWNEESIMERSKRMVQLALDIWPGPEHFKTQPQDGTA